MGSMRSMGMGMGSTGRKIRIREYNNQYTLLFGGPEMKPGSLF